MRAWSYRAVRTTSVVACGESQAAPPHCVPSSSLATAAAAVAALRCAGCGDDGGRGRGGRGSAACGVVARAAAGAPCRGGEAADLVLSGAQAPAVSGTRTILFGSYDNLGRNVGVMFAWIALILATAANAALRERRKLRAAGLVASRE